MRDRRLSIGLRAPLAIFTLTVLMTGTCAAQQTVLHSFNNNGTDGTNPQAGLIFDSSGNLYGTTVYGGSGACSNGTNIGCGTVFELTSTAGGSWTETVLHTFSGTDGIWPLASLVMDASGNLYGTTDSGGAYYYGAVFELTPGVGGSWTETVLHSFNNNGADGYGPVASPIFDSSGNLYGTTCCGGANGYGTVFELTPGVGGSWTETVLHSFNNNGADGYYPEGTLILDGSGSLYGTTLDGGTYGYGTVFELTPGVGGSWTETVLHSFENSIQDGQYPSGGLIFDASGNLYGTAELGGACRHYGAVFRLKPKAGGGWTQALLHSFCKNGTDGTNPSAGLVLVFDASGNLYGTTVKGGTHHFGTAFELTPTASGSWTETVLFSFNGHGHTPDDGLIFDGSGNLYGTTFEAGTYGYGTVFKLTP